MRTEWAVLADTQRARIFARIGGAGWQSIRDLTRTGGSDERNGRELRLPSAMQKLQDTAGRVPDDDFLDRLARELRIARKRGDFDGLILVASPDVLELLQAALDSATKRKLTVAVAENLVSLPVREARRQLSRRF
ncbi:MAG TPA: host attachment protein [Ferrovibrio sp.]|uniref:host attachment protein n=1 Tax=Ferrovibrio sp. TaxID=1917215 RepID=UPI002ED00833